MSSPSPKVPELKIPADILDPGVRAVIVGSAKSVASARAGHYYAHRSNRFWHLLQATGLTGGRFIPHTEDLSVLEFGIGLTDVVPSRAESDDSNITPDDLDLPGFVAKMERLEPVLIAFNGGASANSVSRFLGHGPMAMGAGGWTLAGATTYRLPSSSSRNATGGYAAKEEAWSAFGQWAGKRLEVVPES